jgi:predicted short-subunit dehydrogenase-like oxidoreductase (DUF2520 family)
LTIDQHRFCVIGPGRLGSVVIAGLLTAGLTVSAVGVHADDDTSLFGSLPHVRVRDAALEADAWWLTVPDDEICAVAGRLAEALPAVRRPGAPQPLALHSSGLGSVHLLKPLYERGVRVLCLHPLQTFAGEPDAELLKDVPCAVTALEERDLQLGEELAGRLGLQPFRLADEQKTPYHLAAVFGCNLLVALESAAKGLMDRATGDERGLDHLSALLNTTMKNLLRSGRPALALTGPVARGDIGTVRSHLRLLDRENPRLASAYRALSLEALTLAEPRLEKDQIELLRRVLGGDAADGSDGSGDAGAACDGEGAVASDAGGGANTADSDDDSKAHRPADADRTPDGSSGGRR